jgi:peroxiredoxin Q/BCP
MKKLVAGSLAAALLFGLAINISAAELKVGDPAPNFSMMGSDGKMHSLSDYKGKKAVVIAWYPKAKTPGCTKECISFARDGKLLKAYDVAYFTASVDAPTLNKEFATEVGADYPILSDPTRQVAEAYGVLKAPGGIANRWTFYITKDGKVAYIDKAVKTETHAGDVAAKLGELGVAKK